MTTVSMVKLGFQPKGRERIRRDTPNALIGNPMQPQARPLRRVGMWMHNPEPSTTLGRLERVYLDALAAVDAIEDHKEEARKTGAFTESGINAEALKFAAGRIAPGLHRSRQVIMAARKELAEKRSKLTLQPVDKADLAAALRRQEMRTWLRSLPEKDRNAYTAKVESLDREVAMAIMEMPAPMSGVLHADRDRLLERALEAQHGDAVTELQDLEAGVDLAERAVTMAREELAVEAGVDVVKFDAAARPYERPAGPWLKRVGADDVRVVRWNSDPKTGGSLCVPTPDELATGQFYADLNEYHEAHGITNAA